MAGVTGLIRPDRHSAALARCKSASLDEGQESAKARRRKKKGDTNMQREKTLSKEEGLQPHLETKTNLPSMAPLASIYRQRLKGTFS